MLIKVHSFFLQNVLNDGSFIEDSPFESSINDEEEIICDMKMQKTKTVSIFSQITNYYKCL